jgi:adenine-specific DNA-methyltransferase
MAKKTVTTKGRVAARTKPAEKTPPAPMPPPAEPAKPATIKIAAAKGRPMLTWVGKRPLGHVQAYPAQLVERIDADGSTDRDAPNLLFHGDNKDVLAWLLANGYRGKVQLVYIDPPFDSGADYVRKVSLRGPKGTMKVDGETYSLGEQIQYTDIWANDNYLQFMYERLLLLKELLVESGILVIHLDETRVHYVKAVSDEVFGADRFINEVIWKRQSAHSDTGQGARHLGRLHDSLLVYSAGPEFTWNQLFTPYSTEYVDAFYRHVEPGTGRRYRLSDTTAPGGPGKGNPRYEFLGVTRYWRFTKSKMEELHRDGRIVQTSPGAVPQQKRFLDEMEGVPLQSIWDDLKPIQSQAAERLDYPTQKPEALVSRIVNLASMPGDLVLDCFIGSGTTAAVAQQLGRRWIGCDINKGAIQTTMKRLQPIMEEQALAVKDRGRKQKLFDDGEAPVHGPLSLAVYRVNDYDLQIQHNEAVALACEFLGVQRTRTDRFFDGTRGRQLVKITPFNHPLSPVDVDLVKQELASRPEEDRGILLVCLGMEIAARAAVDDWNRLRKGRAAVNRIEVVELRSDPKYGGFLSHTPAKAKLSITRRKDRLVVEVTDFISPTIVERLRAQAGVVQPVIDDWRAMVDSIMIDPAYDGAVFAVALADIPEKKTQFVEGRYDLPAPAGETTVAVKITDMLGEEVLVAETV